MLGFNGGITAEDISLPDSTHNRSRGTQWALLALVIVALFAAPVVVFLINNRPPNIKVRVPKMPRDNGYDYFVRAGKLGNIRCSPYASPTRKPKEWTAAELRVFMADNANALAELRRGLRKTYLHPPVLDWESDSCFPNYAQFRETARTLSGEALYYELTNQPGRAADSLLDCMEFGVTIPHGGPLIAGLVGVAVEQIGSSHAERVMEKLPASGLARLAARFERVQAKRVTYTGVLRGEIASTSSNLAALFSKAEIRRALADPRNWYDDKLGVLGFAAPAAPGTTAGFRQAWANARLAFTNKTALVRRNEQYMKELAKEQSGPYTGKSSVRAPNDPLAQATREVYVRARAAFCRAEAITTLLRTEVALRRYTADHGRYPDKLDQLVPTYLKAVPIDPFGKGKPMRYKPLDNGRRFLLYSLGLDMVDDGGTAIPLSSGGMSGDYVAGELK